MAFIHARLRRTTARLAPVRALAIGADTNGHFASAAGSVRPDSKIMPVFSRAAQASRSTRCRIAFRVALSIPPSQRARRATPLPRPWPAVHRLFLCLDGCDARCGERRFHPIALQAKVHEALVKAHSSTGKRVKIGGLCYRIELPARLVCEGVGFIPCVFAVTAAKDGGQDQSGRPRPTQVCRLDQRAPMSPAFRAALQPNVQSADPASNAAEPSGISRLSVSGAPTLPFA